MASLGLLDQDLLSKVKGQLLQVDYDPQTAAVIVLEKFQHQESGKFRLNLHFFYKGGAQAAAESNAHLSYGTNFIGDANKAHVDFSDAVLSRARMLFNRDHRMLAIGLVAALAINPRSPKKNDLVIVLKKVLCRFDTLNVSLFKWHPSCPHTLVILDETAKFLHVLELQLEAQGQVIASASIENPSYSVSLKPASGTDPVFVDFAIGENEVFTRTQDAAPLQSQPQLNLFGIYLLAKSSDVYVMGPFLHREQEYTQETYDMFKSLVQNLKSKDLKLKSTETFVTKFLEPLLMHLTAINLHSNSLESPSLSPGFRLPDDLCEPLRVKLMKPSLSGPLKIFNPDPSHKSKQARHLHIIEQQGLTIFAVVDSPGNLKLLGTCSPCVGITGLQSQEGFVDLGQVLLSNKEDYLLVQQQKPSAPVASSQNRRLRTR